MSATFDIWKMLAGVAFFLLAMNFMETALRHLAGRNFKLFLKKHTTGRVKAISAGVIATGVLQSSSIVNLLVLSMVGAGVVQMQNGLALMLGSNLGTTLNSWILATLGFNYSIENFVLPVAGITGICISFISTESKWHYVVRFLFSLAFLFVALGFIKNGMEALVKQTDLTFFNRYPVIVFLILGIFLTGIVQSSSATMAITLSALHSNAIGLTTATAIVLGAEIGTTFKLFLAAAGGLAAKKRVALGNFLFNIITVIILFIFITPINRLISEILQINNSLIALVFFQSFVNFFCILLFAPLLHLFGKFLLRRYIDKEEGSFYINKVPPTESLPAFEAVENETRHLISLAIGYSLSSFHLNAIDDTRAAIQNNFNEKTINEKYNAIKQLHGELHGYYLKLQYHNYDKYERERLSQLSAAIRNIMYAAKNIRDAQFDIEQMRNSSNDLKYNFYKTSKDYLFNFYQRIRQLLNDKKEPGYFKDLADIYKQITAGYADSLKLLYKESMSNRVNEIEISTLINFNREMYTSFKSMLYGLKDYLLTPKEAGYFDNLPGFIR
jgi:phosphate:Na+ symporter